MRFGVDWHGWEVLKHTSPHRGAWPEQLGRCCQTGIPVRPTITPLYTWKRLR